MTNDDHDATDLPSARDPFATLHGSETFSAAAERALGDETLRTNLGRATATIRTKRAAAVAEVPDWEQLRASAAAIKDETLANLDVHLVRFEAEVRSRGGQVHWARDAVEANLLITRLVQDAGARRVVKVKSMTTQETGLNDALAAAGITALETDLAELIVQLAHDRPSHILVPAIHRNRREIRDLFRAHLDEPGVDDEPAHLTEVARRYLRSEFLRAEVAISGANFAVAETGTIAVVESEGNGRMCLTLPKTLITLVGIEKLIPTWRDLEVFLQLLPRSATAERQNPYTSFFSGAVDGQQLHVVLLDNGRTRTLADPRGRTALRCIRCSACLNSCPVYERVGGHSYQSVYPGPIGAVLTPQLTGMAANPDLPFASTLCGACLDVCPVVIDIPRMLVRLREDAVAQRAGHHAEDAVMAAAAWTMGSPRRWHAVGRISRLGRLLGRRRGVIGKLPPPLSRWTRSRDLPRPPKRTFSVQRAQQVAGGGEHTTRRAGDQQDGTS
jgi:L-lactate dehydrogenase complex protein LldF